jgi:hypothetical protein
MDALGNPRGGVRQGFRQASNVGLRRRLQARDERAPGREPRTGGLISARRAKRPMPSFEAPLVDLQSPYLRFQRR